MKIATYTLSLLTILALNGCGQIAIWSAPERIAETKTDTISEASHNAFMSTLKNASYKKLDLVIEKLTSAYLSHPNNARTNLYLGMAHLWAVAERARLKPIPARIIERLTLADFYLGEAAKLAPDDARIIGFQASARMAMGSVHKVERWKRMGYFQAKDAISDYPEFNLFVLSNAMSQLPPHDTGLDEAEDALWKTAEICFGRSIDPTNFNAKVMRNDISLSQKKFNGSQRDRACFNSALAPHNIEGFFLHFGDVLAKKGKAESAKAMYKLTSASPTYNVWPYQNVIKKRIAELDKNIAQFKSAKNVEDEPEIMARASYACVACHQQ